jgi:hypothetical protein
MTRRQIEEQMHVKERNEKERIRIERERPTIEMIKQLLLEIEKKYTEAGYICRKAWDLKYPRDVAIERIKKCETS